MKLISAFIFVILSTEICSSSAFTLKFFSSMIKNKIFNVIDNSIEDTKCATDLKILISDVLQLKLWALKMLDASGKPHPGMLRGNLFLTGNYDECLDISVLVAKTDKIEGQYCSVQVFPANNTKSKFASLFNIEKTVRKMTRKWEKNLPVGIVKNQKIVLGICVPKSCSADLLKRLWNYSQETFHIPLSLIFHEELCNHKDKPLEIIPVDFYIFLFFACMGVLVVGSTLYDIFQRRTGQKMNAFVTFSVYTNSFSLLSTTCENSTLKCLYGIKTLSMFWIIFGHVVTTKAFAPVINRLEIITAWRHRPENSFFMAAPLAVDAFLIISGLLVTYLQMKYSEKYNITLPLYYLHRVLRLWPALLAIIFIHITFIKYLASGPFSYELIHRLADPCIRHWWSTLFFLNNFDTFKDQCVIQSWYLAVDTQLYLISPFIVYGLKKFPSRTLLGIYAACLASFVYTFLVVLLNKYGFVLFFETEGNYDKDVYFSTFSRMPSWLIGVLLGYILYQGKYTSVRLTKTQVFTTKLLAIFTMLALISYHVVFMNREYSAIRSAIFNTFSKPIWSLAVSAIIFLCSTGHGGLIDDFLSHPIFIVLGKLTYSMFLVHLPIIYILLGNQRENVLFNNFENFQDFLTALVMIIVSSLGLSLMFESPVFLFLKQLGNKANAELEMQSLEVTKGE